MTDDLVKALRSVYEKVRYCAYNEEFGKKTLMSPKGNEITVLCWALQEYAKRNGVDLNDRERR